MATKSGDRRDLDDDDDDDRGVRPSRIRPRRRRRRRRAASTSRTTTSIIATVPFLLLVAVLCCALTAAAAFRQSNFAFVSTSTSSSTSARCFRFRRRGGGGGDGEFPIKTTMPLSSSRQREQEATEAAARAGLEGYSVLRQPLTDNWDDRIDPRFAMSPRELSLDSDDDDVGGSGSVVQRQDSEWWQRTQRQQRRRQQQSDSSSRDATTTNVDGNDDDSSFQNYQLDLFRRTQETLDYPQVLHALERFCGTPYARRLVRSEQQQQRQQQLEEESTVPNGGGDGGTSSQLDGGRTAEGRRRLPKRTRRIPSGMEVAYRPLTARDVAGARQRYRAVRELGRLLDASYDGPNLELYKYRSSVDGYKQSVSNLPWSKSSADDLDLELVLEVAGDRGRVLDGEDIAEVADLMDTFATVRNWGDALKEVKVNNNSEQTEATLLLDVDEREEENVALEFLELPKLTDCITVNETLQDLLRNAFEEEPKGGSKRRSRNSVDLGRFCQLSGTTFPTVGRLRARVRELRRDIRSTLESLAALPSVQSKLALESGGALISEVSGSGRLVIPVVSTEASSVGIVHDTSRSGKTAYVEPTEIVGPTNELRQLESELRTEEARIWRLLTEEILHNRVDLETSAAALGQLDLVRARYRLGQELQGVIPLVKDEGSISLRNAKHPVLLLRHKQNVVGSDVDLGSNGNQGLVLTGPNSGGKTIILKLLGLVALMARAGIPLPADGPSFDYRERKVVHRPRVDFFDPVLADIGDIQSVGGDLSTFSGHMLVCREVLANSRENALVLMDEVRASDAVSIDAPQYTYVNLHFHVSSSW